VSGQVLSQRALNRALLSRQLLLDRVELPAEAAGRRAAVIATIEHLVGLQAQAPFPPYYGLWSRLGGFQPDDLAALAQAVRAHVPLVQVPPHAVWGRSGQSMHTSAERWLGPRAAADPAGPPTLAGLVTRYLAAFGPATARDVTAWSGLTGLRAVMDELRPSLITFRDEQGAELFDLPSAPRPDSDVPAPVRLAAEFDNLLLSHADRSRVVHPDHLRRFYTINGIFPGSVLIDGFVAGMWRLARAKHAATLTIELFGSARERARVRGEAERLLAFCAPGATHDIRFAPIA
jgi:hypothetical protein